MRKNIQLRSCMHNSVKKKKHPTRIRLTTNNACRAELGKISTNYKRAMKFWKHLKFSDPHYKCNTKSWAKKPIPSLNWSRAYWPSSHWFSEPEQHCQNYSIKPNYSTNETQLHHWLGNSNTTTKSNAILFGPIERISHGRLSDTQKIESHLDQVQTQWTQALNRDRKTWLPQEQRSSPHTLWSEQNQDRAALF